DKIQHLPFDYHDRTATGQLMSRCTEDVGALSRFVGQGSVVLLSVGLFLTGVLVLLFRQSVSLTLIGLGPLILLGLLTMFVARIIDPMFTRIDQALGDTSSALQKTFSGVQVVRASARDHFKKEKFARANR